MVFIDITLYNSTLWHGDAGSHNHVQLCIFCSPSLLCFNFLRLGPARKKDVSADLGTALGRPVEHHGRDSLEGKVITDAGLPKDALDFGLGEAVVGDGGGHFVLELGHLVGKKVQDEEDAAGLEPLGEPLSCEGRVVKVVKSEADGGNVEVVEFLLRGERLGVGVGGGAEVALVGVHFLGGQALVLGAGVVSSDHVLREIDANTLRGIGGKSSRDNASTAGIVQHPHLLFRSLFFALVFVAFVLGIIVILNPVNTDKVEPGPDLLDNLVQRLFVFAVIRCSLFVEVFLVAILSRLSIHTVAGLMFMMVAMVVMMVVVKAVHVRSNRSIGFLPDDPWLFLFLFFLWSRNWVPGSYGTGTRLSLLGLACEMTPDVSLCFCLPDCA